MSGLALQFTGNTIVIDVESRIDPVGESVNYCDPLDLDPRVLGAGTLHS